MPRLVDMIQAAMSLRRLVELMEADIRKEEGVETPLRNRGEMDAFGDLVAEYFWKKDELKALNRGTDRRGNDFYDQARKLTAEIYDLEKQIRAKMKEGEK